MQTGASLIEVLLTQRPIWCERVLRCDCVQAPIISALRPWTQTHESDAVRPRISQDRSVGPRKIGWAAQVYEHRNLPCMSTCCKICMFIFLDSRGTAEHLIGLARMRVKRG
jgi:hypothetical protein